MQFGLSPGSGSRWSRFRGFRLIVPFGMIHNLGWNGFYAGARLMCPHCVSSPDSDRVEISREDSPCLNFVPWF